MAKSPKCFCHPLKAVPHKLRLPFFQEFPTSLALCSYRVLNGAIEGMPTSFRPRRQSSFSLLEPNVARRKSGGRKFRGRRARRITADAVYCGGVSTDID
jgi:hypothetical protein